MKGRGDGRKKKEEKFALLHVTVLCLIWFTVTCKPKTNKNIKSHTLLYRWLILMIKNITPSPLPLNDPPPSSSVRQEWGTGFLGVYRCSYFQLQEIWHFLFGYYRHIKLLLIPQIHYLYKLSLIVKVTKQVFQLYKIQNQMVKLKGALISQNIVSKLFWEVSNKASWKMLHFFSPAILFDHRSFCKSSSNCLSEFV